MTWADTWAAVRKAIDSDGRASVNEIAGQTPQPDPFRVLVSTIISLRTRDAVTFAASERLFRVAETPHAMLELDTATIAELIYPAGFYRTKSETIATVSRLLVERYDGTVPRTLEELTELPGVGRKTANLVLAVGHGIDAICVDIHVHRISNRLGWVSTRTPEATERELMQVMPRQYWIPMNEWLVKFGQQVCTPQSPRCSQCPLAGECPRVGVTRSR